MTDTTPSLRLLILRRILAVLDALKASQGVRVVERRNDILQNETRLPAIHLVDGDETVTGEPLDWQGYTIQFPITVKCMAIAADAHEEADLFAARVQEAIEAEPTLDGSPDGDFAGEALAIFVRYQGTEFFTSEVGKPRAGCLVHYLVEYRRKRATPTQTY